MADEGLGHLNVNRPIHYLGSKLRLIRPILETLDKVDPSGGGACDLFAGSGTVSQALSKKRRVVSVDIQEYSRVLCTALLLPSSVDSQTVTRFWFSVRSSEHSERLKWAVEPLVAYETGCLDKAVRGDLEPLCDLVEHGSLIALEQNLCSANYSSLRLALAEVLSRLSAGDLMGGPAALTLRHYGGNYFSFAQAAQIDTLLEAIEILPSAFKNVFLAAVLSTASEVVNTVGKQFAQPLRPRTGDGKPKKNLYQLVARDRFTDLLHVYEGWLNRYLSIPKPSKPHQVLRQDYEEALSNLEGKVSVVYADPPYTRDHYSRFYHVLETLCLRDNPSVSTVRIKGQERLSRGFYRVERHQSPFCIKSQAPRAFSTLFERTRQLGVPLVLSYSPYERQSGARPRLLTMVEIERLAKRFFKRVDTLRAGRMAHNKLNHAEKNVGVNYDAEVLVICEP
jgi:adenine-specific DNA methylase